MGKAAKVKQNPAASKANGSVTSKPEAAAKPAAATNGKASKKDKKTKAVPVKEPTPESSSSDEDSDEEDSDEEDSDDSDDEDIKPVAAPAAKAANNAAANAKTAVTKTATQAKEAVKGKVNAAAKAVEATTAAATSSDDSSDEDSSSDEEESAAATTAAAVKDTAAKKGKQAVEATKTAVAKATEETSDSDDSDDSDDEEEAPKAGNKRSAEESGSDSDSDEDSDEEMEGAPETKKDSKPAAKKAKVDEDPNATNTVYVGGLSWGVDEAALKEYFSHYGDISSVRIITDSNSGKSKGFGYVDFVEKSSATASLELNETEWEGRTVKVNYSQPKADRGAAAGGAPKRVFNDELSAPSQTLFVGNLPFSATEDQVWEIFGEYGKVSSVRLPTDKEDGRPKGFGYVEFLSQEDASKACEAGRGAGLEIDGRQLRLDFSTPRPPREEGGFGGRGGGRGGFSDRGGSRGRGGFSDRGGSRGGRGRGGFSSDRGRGGGGAPRGRGGADGGWGGRGKAVRTGAALPSEGKKISFD